MKRSLAIAAIIFLMFNLLNISAYAENDPEEPQFTDEELAEMEEEQKEAEKDTEEIIAGEVYQEKTKEDFDLNSPALYTGTLRKEYSIFSQKDTKSKRLRTPKEQETTVDILYVGLRWMIVRKNKTIGYVKREYMAKSTIQALDPVNTPPFNVQKHSYIAKTATECHVRKSMIPYKEGDNNDWVVLNPGTEISIWKFYKGWAMVNYHREYGYIDPNELTDMLPVSPTDEELYKDCPIGAYTSYYNMSQSEHNLNRIHNIKTGCNYISRVLQPGEKFDANKIMGPYNPSKGYRKAGVLTEGGTTIGYGGGTCQVSSTLYNVLIQLPMINIVKRRPHGGGGASYLPIHCDAAVGNPEINLIFENQYDFPIRIEGKSNSDGALLVCIYREH